MILYDFEPEFGRFAEYEFGIGAITSTQEKTDNSFVSTYPNPAGDFLYIDLLGMEGQVVSISLSNSMMKNILEKSISINSNQFHTDLSIGHLSPGIYIMTIQYANQTVVKKVIKQ
jgi:hypothetical protein